MDRESGSVAYFCDGVDEALLSLGSWYWSDRWLEKIIETNSCYVMQFCFFQGR